MSSEKSGFSCAMTVMVPARATMAAMTAYLGIVGLHAMDSETRACIRDGKSAISPLAAEPVEFYFVPSSVRKSVDFVRQLRGPHLSMCA